MCEWNHYSAKTDFLLVKRRGPGFALLYFSMRGDIIYGIWLKKRYMVGALPRKV